MENETPKTGIIYCRVSSKEQVDGTSLESQERLAKEYADREGIEVLKVFIERGESAKTADRTEFTKAISFCTEKKIAVGYFIVYKLDRFARNQEDHIMVQAILKKAGTKLRSVTEPINDSPVGKVLEGMIALFSEFDNNIRTERSRQGMQERLKQGVWVWQAPLGYRRAYKGANIAPDPEIAPLIKLSFEEYAKAIYTYDKLADFIFERGLRTKKGKKPSAQLMEKILKNKIYCGIIDTWGEYEGTFETIISKELFNRCQKEAIKGVHATPRSANNPLFPLRSVLACEECNTSITGSSSVGRKGIKYPYYHHPHQKCSKAIYVPKEAMEQQFVELLQDITPSGKYEKLFKAIVLDIWKNNYKKLDEENTRIRKDIVRLEEERQKVFEFHRTGKYSDNDFLQQKKIINESIEQKHALIGNKMYEGFSMDVALENCFTFVRNTAKEWVRADYHTKLRIQKLVFKSKVPCDGKTLGTAELSQVYRINQLFVADKSSLVAPRGVEPLLPG